MKNWLCSILQNSSSFLILAIHFQLSFLLNDFYFSFLAKLQT